MNRQLFEYPSLPEGTIKNENSVLLQEALEPHYIHEVGESRAPLNLTSI